MCFLFKMLAIYRRKVVGDMMIILLPYRKVQGCVFNLKKEGRRSLPQESWYQDLREWSEVVEHCTETWLDLGTALPHQLRADPKHNKPFQMENISKVTPSKLVFLHHAMWMCHIRCPGGMPASVSKSLLGEADHCSVIQFTKNPAESSGNCWRWSNAGINYHLMIEN